jgi:PAS domain S-box-containing protein
LLDDPEQRGLFVDALGHAAWCAGVHAARNLEDFTAGLHADGYECAIVSFPGLPAGMIGSVKRQLEASAPAFVAVVPRDDHQAMSEAIEIGADSYLFQEILSETTIAGSVRLALDRRRKDKDRLQVVEDLKGANDRLSEANSALRESEQRFRGVFVTAPHGMALVSPEGRWLTVNPALCAMLGYTEEELLGLSFQDITYPEDLDADLAHVQQMLAGEIPYYRMEKRYVRKDGSLMWALLSVSLVRDALGEPIHFVSEILDLTETKAAQDELQRAHRLEAVGQLTGGIAHDFNNLLMAMQLNLEVLEGVVEDPLGADSVRMLGNAVKRGSELTERLLQFARRQPLQPRLVNINEQIAEAVALIHRTLREDIEIVQQFGEDVWPCEVDPGQFQNAIVNLAVNASDAMPTGGTLSIETRNLRQEDLPGDVGQGGRAGDYVSVVLRDTGMGMEPEVVDRVFEPFFTTKDVGKGTGLGLSMVYGFVKQSGGHIRVASQKNCGTTITIHLPRAEEAEMVEAPSLASAANPSSACGGLERVLVVEDSDDVRRTLSIMLRKEGYEVRAAATGREALHLLDADGFSPQMLIADVVLPERITGREVAEAVLLRIPDCKVLFMSGYAENVLVHDGRVDKGMMLLSKPFSRRQLMERISRLLEEPEES